MDDNFINALRALQIAEAALADIGDADREPGDDVAWCEKRAAQALPAVRAAIAEAIKGMMTRKAKSRVPPPQVLKKADGSITYVDELSISVRTANCLKAEGIYEIDKLLTMNVRQLRKVPNVGDWSVTEIVSALSEHGLALARA